MKYSDSRAGDETARSASDHDDLMGRLSRRPLPPTNFNVMKVSNQATLGFVMGDNQSPQTRYATVEYRVYATPYSVLADPATIAIPGRMQDAFNAGQLVNSITAPGKGGNISFYDAKFVGVGCWFFCVSVNGEGTESIPTDAVENPTNTVLGGGNDAGDGNDSDIPLDVTAAQVLLEPDNVNGRKLVRVTVTALVPRPKGSFAAYQIYLQNYQEENEAAEDGQVVEGPRFIAQLDALSGSSLSGVFWLEPDSPVPYDQGSIAVTNGSRTIDALENANWDKSWAAPRRLCFFATAQAETTGAPHRYDDEISSVSAFPGIPTLDLVAGAAPWRTQQYLPYIIYVPDRLAIKYTPHPVRMYFVSLSRGGTRRADVLNSPYVEFQFGISRALSKPLNPAEVVVNYMGGTVRLAWDSVSSVSNFDNSIDRFNIYRRRIGTYSNWSYLSRPTGVYAVVPKETIVSSGGSITWVDRKFNVDVTIDPTVSGDGWDFDTTNPGVYAYWVTAVNVEGTENRTAYWGLMDVITAGPAPYTITWVSGDRFSSDYEGQTMSNGSVDRVVAYDAWSILVPEDLATTSPFPSLGEQPFFVGPVTGAIVLMGNTGGEDDTTVYRDNFNNRLFNARLFCITGAADTAFSRAFGSTYGPALSDGGQPTYTSYYSLIVWPGANPSEVESGARYDIGTQGRQTIGSNNSDSWSIWEYLRSSGGMVIPYFKADPAAAAGTPGIGEVVLDPSPAATAADYTVMWQHAKKSKFLAGEDLVLSVYAKTGATTGDADVGLVHLQMIRYDFTAYAGPPAWPNGVERDSVGATFSCSILTSSFDGPAARLIAIGRLPKLDPDPIALTLVFGVAVATATGGLYPFSQAWIGCNVTLTAGANTQSSVILQMANADPGDPTMFDTITFAPAWGFAGAVGTASVIIKFTHYAFKIGLLGPNTHMIHFKKPMVNGGRIGAAWQPNMRQDDEPGGDLQDPRGGNPDRYDPVTYRCVPAGTPVLTPDGPRPIESMRPGDLVISRVRSGLKPRPVSEVTDGLVRRLVDLNGGSVVLTSSTSHRVAIRSKKGIRWVRAEKVKLGDVLVGEVDGAEVSIPVVGIGIRDAPSPIRVFTLTVRGGENYFAGGILCHNKPAPIPPT